MNNVIYSVVYIVGREIGSYETWKGKSILDLNLFFQGPVTFAKRE